MIERTITINGFSKAFAMTGWRLGYGAAPEPIAKAMAKVQGTFTAGANAFVQQAAIAALRGGRKEVQAMCDIYRQRRAMVVDELGRLPGVRVKEPGGTFYAFPDVSDWLAQNGQIGTVDALCDWLLDRHCLALVPGSAFGQSRCIRLSFAASEGTLKEGLRRLARAMNERP